ncbi:SDR family NAD(P)-dependent oxidoreductase [Novosphingobium kaempferiae]|uniref:SDR family NAD(P)-dependent oxidoreductase n=1 Tax=Novosphingobium kaempferiae TaxID=2896849 RepID=UPI001E4BFDF0|nr:SDR family NAD(P)-dependent oxidoreductase [Novosphingobium kaempferiae]
MSTPLRTAVVTGAAKGIGAAAALALSRSGYHVAASDIDGEGLKRTRKVVEAAGGSIAVASLDVRHTDAVASYAAGFGQVDLLVSNAGFASVAFLEELDDAHWQAVTDLNLTSHMRLARAFAPGMKAQKSGRIVCLGSIAGHTYGWPGRLAYSASKAGVTGLVRTLAMELGPHGITVNGVAPAGLHAAAEQIPLRRVGTPEDIADFIVMLGSDGARFMTGQMLSVDGGMSVSL